MPYSLRTPRAAHIAFAVAALFLLLVAQPAWAAQLPSATEFIKESKELLIPLLNFAQWLIGGACVILGFWEAFKASRGNSQGWVKAILLFVVAGIVFAPTLFFEAIGLNDVADKLNGLGLGPGGVPSN